MDTTTLVYTTPADAVLCREVVDYLSGPGFPALQGVIVEVLDGVVTLRGPTRSYYARQLLVHGCERVPHVAAVIDELQVINRFASRRTKLAE
jgi:osmotically-inducible protein OsmY